MIKIFVTMVLIAAALMAQSSEGTMASIPHGGSNPLMVARVAGHLMTKKVVPKYPKVALERGDQGVVPVAITIDVRGLVTKAEAVSGPESLKATSVEAARQFQFRPYELNDNGTLRKIAINTVVVFRFTVSKTLRTRKGRVEYLADARCLPADCSTQDFMKTPLQ